MRYFKESEFTMNGQLVFDKMNPEFLELLDNLRDLVREPLRVNSSYRSEEYNKSIGGSLKSTHMYGIAADLLSSFQDFELGSAGASPYRSLCFP